MMLGFFFRVKIVTISVFTNLIYQAVSEAYVDGAKGLKRDTKNGVAYANFAAHKFSHLDLPPLVSASVKEFRECGQLCVDHSSCFSFNCAAFLDNVERKILCQLLQSDKYNKSSKFAPSAIFHHFSIKVGEKKVKLKFYLENCISTRVHCRTQLRYFTAQWKVCLFFTLETENWIYYYLLRENVMQIFEKRGVNVIQRR